LPDDYLAQLTPSTKNSDNLLVMAAKRQEALMKAQTWLRRSFVSGLVVVAPIGLTLYILHWFVVSADEMLQTLPEAVWPKTMQQIPGLGLVAAFLVVLMAGAVARNLSGRWLLLQVNSLVERIPVVASLYRLVRQIAEAFLGSGHGAAFERVVLVEWPRKDIWTIAFVTSGVKGELATRIDGVGPFLNLFVPTTPNPTGGFHFIAPERDCRASGLSVEAAFKVVISGGALAPDAPLGKVRTPG
jgi:uncharacterized membrane protein